MNGREDKYHCDEVNGTSHVFTERVRGDVTLEGMTSVLAVERVLLHKLDSPGREVTRVEEQTRVFLQQGEHKVTDTTSHF